MQRPRDVQEEGDAVRELGIAVAGEDAAHHGAGV